MYEVGLTCAWLHRAYMCGVDVGLQIEQLTWLLQASQHGHCLNQITCDGIPAPELELQIDDLLHRLRIKSQPRSTGNETQFQV